VSFGKIGFLIYIILHKVQSSFNYTAILGPQLGQHVIEKWLEAKDRTWNSCSVGNSTLKHEKTMNTRACRNKKKTIVFLFLRAKKKICIKFESSLLATSPFLNTLLYCVFLVSGRWVIYRKRGTVQKTVFDSIFCEQESP
jgi:hypothetical protein